jgi:hypothetical protein
MMELAMASLCPYQPPIILLQPFNNIANLARQN